ncbi:MAG: nitrilase-related carbon-nitrogen hydrolase, partial [Armatimonadota bacterium]|nr:nitrilase-related carbon-nitrogen hydrolase [Armatimonadota bacterium]
MGKALLLTAVLLVPHGTACAASQSAAAPKSLAVGVAQTSLEATLEANCAQIIQMTRQARQRGCRVVVFPEAALYSPPSTPRAAIDQAVTQIQEAARTENLYVLFGLRYKERDRDAPHERLLLLGPDGRVLHTYDKLWADARFPNAPGLFHIDGIPCAATLCADRWLRAVEELPVFAGARILFECSANFANEWIPNLEWYWYVPRALRNGVYVVFANTAHHNPGTATPGHGHSAVVAPDGAVITAAGAEARRLLVARLDLTRATAAEAARRATHPLFRAFWQTGVRILQGESVAEEAFEPLTAPPTRVTLAAAQMACSRNPAHNLSTMERLISEAKARGADAVAFPETCVTGAIEADIRAAAIPMLQEALDRLRQAARRAGIVVVFGMPWREGQRRFNA